MPSGVAPPRIAPAPPEPHEDDQYAARLQAAVADLTQRVHDEKAEDPPDARMTELAERLEATVARGQRLEATVATLAESLDGVTGGVEEAFAVLQSGMSGMAIELARLETGLAELAAAPSEPQGPDPALTARLDELRAGLDALQSRLEGAATRDDVAADLADQRETLDDLREAVESLAARPTGSPDLDERLARIETRLDERLRTTADAAAVEALAERIEGTAETHIRLLDSLDALRHRVDELARPQDGPGEDAVRRVEALEARVSTLAPQLDELGDLRSEASRRLDGLERASADQAVLAERLDELQGAPGSPGRPGGAAPRGGGAGRRPRGVEALRTGLADRLDRERAASDGRASALEQALERVQEEMRSAAGADAVAELRRGLDVVRDELRGAPRSTLSADPAQVEALADLAARVERGSAETDARLGALQARLDVGAGALEELTGALDAVRSRSPPSRPAHRRARRRSRNRPPRARCRARPADRRPRRDAPARPARPAARPARRRPRSALRLAAGAPRRPPCRRRPRRPHARTQSPPAAPTPQTRPAHRRARRRSRNRPPRDPARARGAHDGSRAGGFARAARGGSSPATAGGRRPPRRRASRDRRASAGHPRRPGRGDRGRPSGAAPRRRRHRPPRGRDRPRRRPARAQARRRPP